MSNSKNKTAPASSVNSESVVAALDEALSAVRNLIAQRLEAKLSVARLSGVARELKELLKVMSVYGA